MSLLALVVIAQFNPCGDLQNCVDVGSQDGGTVRLSGVVKTSKGTLYQGDGGTGPALLSYTADLAPQQAATTLRVLGNQARTSTQPDVVLGGVTARDGGSSTLVQFKTG